MADLRFCGLLLFCWGLGRHFSFELGGFGPWTLLWLWLVCAGCGARISGSRVAVAGGLLSEFGVHPCPKLFWTPVAEVVNLIM